VLVAGSMAAMSGAWLRKKVRHSWLGDPRRLTMYLTPVAPTIQSYRTANARAGSDWAVCGVSTVTKSKRAVADSNQPTRKSQA
jgi:hypothetical protein